MCSRPAAQTMEGVSTLCCALLGVRHGASVPFMCMTAALGWWERWRPTHPLPHSLTSAKLTRCFVPDDYRTYVDKMARDGTWGDHLTLQAAADAYGVRIMVITRCVLADVAVSSSPHARARGFKTVVGGGRAQLL
jgi:hypothetical protein